MNQQKFVSQLVPLSVGGCGFLFVLTELFCYSSYFMPQTDGRVEGMGALAL